MEHKIKCVLVENEDGKIEKITPVFVTSSYYKERYYNVIGEAITSFRDVGYLCKFNSEDFKKIVYYIDLLRRRYTPNKYVYMLDDKDNIIVTTFASLLDFEEQSVYFKVL